MVKKVREFIAFGLEVIFEDASLNKGRQYTIEIKIQEIIDERNNRSDDISVLEI